MPSMRDDWGALTPSWLTTFLAVAEHLNYTRAAEALFLTQSAVSRQMKALQRATGVRLVERMGRSLELTQAGSVLVGEAERLRGNLERAREALEEVRRGSVGQVRVGASTTPGLYVLPPALGPFLRDRPGAEVTLRVANTLAIEEALLRNELDVGFVGGHLVRAELSAEPLVDDEVLVYASRSHALARARRVDPERLVQELFVMREPGSATRRAFEGWLAERGLVTPRLIELACPEAIKRLVVAGAGVALSSCQGLPARGGGFRVLRVPGLDLPRTLLIVRHAHKVLSPLALDLVQAVQRAARPCRRAGSQHGAPPAHDPDVTRL